MYFPLSRKMLFSDTLIFPSSSKMKNNLIGKIDFLSLEVLSNRSQLYYREKRTFAYETHVH